MYLQFYYVLQNNFEFVTIEIYQFKKMSKIKTLKLLYVKC